MKSVYSHAFTVLLMTIEKYFQVLFQVLAELYQLVFLKQRTGSAVDDE